MSDLIDSMKKFILVIVLLVSITFGVIVLFDEMIARPMSLSTLVVQTTRIAIVVVSGSLVIYFIRRSKPVLARRVGDHPVALFQFFMVLVVVVIAIFAVLHILQVPSTTLLLGGSVASIIVGIVLSTFVGSILAGMLVLVTHPFRVGDTVFVNNIPCRIVEITTMVTRVRNDIGGILAIPNTAIVQGSVLITKVPPHHEVLSQSRLPYSLGDRVCTTYMAEEGVVRELTPFHTKILLDSGKELSFLNTSVLTGSVAVAKISSNSNDTIRFSFKIAWDVEKTIEAIENAATLDRVTFKSIPIVLYSSLNGDLVELETSCKIDPNKRGEARHIILKAAHSVKPSRMHA